MSAPDRTAEVLTRLSRVSDPELDEPVTDLGFITDIAIEEAGVVKIAFQLPTYWCAANFAFMMADDMRREVAVLPWVTKVEPLLGDHMYADRINAGVAGGKSFEACFADTSDGVAVGDLSDLRRTFLIKALQRRQEALLRHMLETGFSATMLVEMTIEELAKLELDQPGAGLRDRYIQRRDVVGSVSTNALAFVTAEALPINAADLSAYLRLLGRMNVSAEFNGALCRGLLAARFGEPGAEPSFQYFVQKAASDLRSVA